MNSKHYDRRRLAYHLGIICTEGYPFTFQKLHDKLESHYKSKSMEKTWRIRSLGEMIQRTRAPLYLGFRYRARTSLQEAKTGGKNFYKSPLNLIFLLTEWQTCLVSMSNFLDHWGLDRSSQCISALKTDFCIPSTTVRCDQLLTTAQYFP